MIKSYYFLLIGILLIQSCTTAHKENSPYSPSADYYLENNDVRFVSSFDHEVALSNPRQIDTEVIGVSDFAIRNGVVVAMRNSEDDLFTFLSASDYQELGRGVSVGGAPLEIPNSGSLSMPETCTLYTDGGHLHMSIYHMYKGRILDVDVTSTIKNKTYTAQLADSLPSELFQVTRIGDGKYLTKQLSEDKKRQPLSFWSKGEMSVSENLSNLNLAETEVDFNLFGSLPAISPDGKWVVNAMSSLNQINFIPVSEKEKGFTVCAGETLKSLRDADDTAQKYDERMLYYQSAKAQEKYVCFLYANMTFMDFIQQKNTSNAVIQCFKWDGTPLAKLTLDRQISAFDVNENRNTLLVLDTEDNLLEYDLPDCLNAQ